MSNLRKPIKHLRWWIGGLLFASTVVNYIDRQTLNVLAPYLKTEFGWTNTDFASIVIAFRIAYTIMQSLGGRLVDWLGTRRGLTLTVSWYTVAAVLPAFATGLWSFRLFRFLLGVGEAPNWPAATKAVAEWFPARERGWAVALFDSGSSIGAAIAPSLVVWLFHAFGSWRPVFVLTALLGCLWLVAWRALYHPPESHPRLSPEELRLIRGEPTPHDPRLETIDLQTDLAEELRPIEAALRREVQTNPQKFLGRFRALPESCEGRFGGPDHFKETFDVFAKAEPQERARLSRVVQNASSRLAELWYQIELRRPEPGRTKIHFVTGAPGSGKTTYATAAVTGSGTKLVYEVNLRDIGRARELLRQALDAGYEPVITDLWADPMIALERAWRRAGDEARGRTVGVDDIVRTFNGLSPCLVELEQEFRGRVDIHAIDNTGSQPVKQPIEFVRREAYNIGADVLRERLHARLDEIYKRDRATASDPARGALLDRAYREFKGVARSGDRTGHGRPAPGGAAGQRTRGTGETETDLKAHPGWVTLLKLPQTWGILFARLLDPYWFLVADWFAIFLVSKGYKLEETLVGFWVPFLAADLGNFFGGGLSSFFIRRGWRLGAARKAVFLICGPLMLLLTPAAYTESFVLLITYFGLATFGYAACSTIFLTLPSDLYDSGAVATVSGITGTGAGIFTIVSTYTIGAVTDRYGFQPVLVGASLVPVVATAALFLLVRNTRHTRAGLVREI